MSDQSDAGATSETAKTSKIIHTKHTPTHTNKANMEWGLRRPNDIRDPWGPKVSRHLSYLWGKTPKRTSLRKPVPTGDRTRARCVTSAHITTCSTASPLSPFQNSCHLSFPLSYQYSKKSGWLPEVNTYLTSCKWVIILSLPFDLQPLVLTLTIENPRALKKASSSGPVSP